MNKLHTRRKKKDHTWKRKDPTSDSAIQAPTKQTSQTPTQTCKKHSCSPNNQNQANTRERAKRMRKNEENESYL